MKKITCCTSCGTRNCGTWSQWSVRDCAKYMCISSL